MHEFSLYGNVTANEHRRILMQLAGVTRMPPQRVEEIRLVFKAKPPIGLNNLPSAGGSQGVQQQDIQRVKTMLNASLYYVQLVGRIHQTPVEHLTGDSSTEVLIKDGSAPSVKWTLEFRDTPDPGKQVVSSRLISKIPLQDGNPAAWLGPFGYEYVSRYMVSASEFYDDFITLALRQVLQVPEAKSVAEAGDITSLPDKSEMQLLDPSGGYELHAFMTLEDGLHPELKERATKQLLEMKDTLRQAVSLSPGDRLALDTKVPIGPRRL